MGKLLCYRCGNNKDEREFIDETGSPGNYCEKCRKEIKQLREQRNLE